MTAGLPWLSEPDELQWRDPFTGYDCRIRRASMAHYLGHLCGYVRVPEDHPFYRCHYLEPVPARAAHHVARVMGGPSGKRGVLDLFTADPNAPHVGMLLNVHGSITWAGFPHDDPGWWYGFDCGHCDDLSPGLLAIVQNLSVFRDQTYRTLEYVQGECTSLAAQLHRLAEPAPLLLGHRPALTPESVPTRA